MTIHVISSDDGESAAKPGQDSNHTSFSFDQRTKQAKDILNEINQENAR